MTGMVSDTNFVTALELIRTHQAGNSFSIYDVIGWVCIIVFSLVTIALSIGVIRLYTKGRHNWD